MADDPFLKDDLDLTADDLAAMLEVSVPVEVSGPMPLPADAQRVQVIKTFGGRSASSVRPVFFPARTWVSPL